MIAIGICREEIAGILLQMSVESKTHGSVERSGWIVTAAVNIAVV